MAFKHVVDPGKLEAARAAGQAAARFLSLDPAFWLEQAGLAGVQFVLLKQKGFVTNCLEADFETAVFLEGWMDASEGSMAAVDALLRQHPSTPR